jgi:hypothetical protein
MKNKLILLEGIPGSGKSTFARFISLQLERNGYQSQLYHESTFDHPLFLSSNDFESVDRWMFSYLENWRRFMKDIQNYDSTVVLESALIQYPIINLLHKDIDRNSIIAFVDQIANELKDTEVTLVYFFQENQANFIRNMIHKRGGADFLKQKYEQHKAEPFYVNRNHTGSELHVDFLTEYAELAHQVFDRYKWSSISIENSEEKWVSYQQNLLNDLNLTYVPDPTVNQEDLKKYVGKYRNENMNIDVNIEISRGYLIIFGNRQLKVMSDEKFYLDDISVEVVFKTDNFGKVTGLVIGEKDIYANRNDEGTHFFRIS